MNWKSIAFGGILVGGAVYLLNQFSNKIGYTFQGLKWLGLDGLKIRLALKMQLDNGNDIPATVTSFKGKLNYGGYDLTDINIDTPVVLPPGGSEKLEVKFSINPGTLLAEIIKFFDEKPGISRFKIKGILTGKVGQVPYAYPVNETIALAD